MGRYGQNVTWRNARLLHKQHKDISLINCYYLLATIRQQTIEKAIRKAHNTNNYENSICFLKKSIVNFANKLKKRSISYYDGDNNRTTIYRNNKWNVISVEDYLDIYLQKEKFILFEMSSYFEMFGHLDLFVSEQLTKDSLILLNLKSENNRKIDSFKSTRKQQRKLLWKS